jgi:hypothetical protein
MTEHELKPGFIYLKSEILKQKIAISEKTGWVFCEDKVRYSPQEIQALNKAGAEIDLRTHLAKKVFEGEVIKIEDHIYGNGQTKPDKGGGDANTSDNTDTQKEIHGAHGVSAENTNGKFEIF